jgi:hypothetical protein
VLVIRRWPAVFDLEKTLAALGEQRPFAAAGYCPVRGLFSLAFSGLCLTGPNRPPQPSLHWSNKS